MNASIRPPGAYGASDDIVDYILGITFEIWEQRGVDLIRQYYTPQTPVYSLEGVLRGSEAMIAGTRNMLAAFPDRLLIPDDVIWSGDCDNGFYTSHRIISPMTNEGPSVYGAATGRQVRILTVADCVVENGVITREWLVRDNHALVAQLGFDPLTAARDLAARRNEESTRWIRTEIERLQAIGTAVSSPIANGDTDALAHSVLVNHWYAGDRQNHDAMFAPYAVLHRSPIELCSGRAAIAKHYAGLRAAFDVDGISVDHVAEQPFGRNGRQVAARWTLTARQVGEFLGLPATGERAYLLGVTHWRLVDGRIITEWTIFDGIGVLSQLAAHR